jgi:tetrahydromethanopterin S-methyltransferase subunit A
MTTENAHHDISTNEYKIFKLSNSSGDYYVSYTRQKYLTRVVENFKRKKTDTFTKLFNGYNIKIELLEIVNSENIYFIKNKINDYITKEDQKHNVKNKEQVEQTKQEQVEQEQVEQEQVEQETSRTRTSRTRTSRTKTSRTSTNKTSRTRTSGTRNG